MRLVKQCFLYFKEGNSDKVYEIDLCEVGNDRYVVNFRYGKRNAQLKEGSKTPVPVNLEEAERIYDAVETEKLNKGYTTSSSGISELPAKKVFVLDSTPGLINTNWSILPAGRNKAILQRLHNTVNGTAHDAKFPWKLSRVIWKAGECRIREAVPYIIQLYNKGDQLHQYCCTWALVRCAAGSADALSALKTIHAAHPSRSVSKIAGAGLIKNLHGNEKETHLIHYINRLPEDFKIRVEKEIAGSLDKFLSERVAQQQPAFNWLEDLYLLSVEKKWLINSLKKLLLELPLKPNYFRHIRGIFKLAELLDDFEIYGLLACRFERETEMFSHDIAVANTSEKVYIPEIEKSLNPLKELKKTTSRLAYSQKTRWYFHRRVFRQLQMTGNNEDTAYVKLATALLIGYKFKVDFREHYSTYTYELIRNRYERVENRFLQNAHAVFLHQILSGDNPSVILQPNHLWRVNNRKEAANQKAGKNSDESALGGFFKKLTGLFGKKKAVASPVEEPVVKEEESFSGTPFLHLWNKVPQAYIQLLMDAELEEIHQFAEQNLVTHPEYTAIKTKLGQPACIQLLSSPFEIPARVGYTLVVEKYSTSIPNEGLVLAMLNSVYETAVAKGKQWTESYHNDYLQQSRFITALIFAKHASVRSWAKTWLKNNSLPVDIKKAVAGKAVAELINFGDQTTENELIIKDATDTLFELLDNELQQVNIGVVADLLQHPNASVLMFGLRLLKEQKQLHLKQLSKEFLSGLLQHPYAPVREEGISLLIDMDEASLLQYQDAIINSCLSGFENVRQGIAPVMQRMAIKERSFGVSAAERLMPYLLRKETSVGLHADISKLLCNELSGYLQNANKETALNLLYSNYSAAQDVGVVILEKYTDADQLTVPQVIALGGHENLNVREWSWKFYSAYPPRIKYEKETAIKLLGSKWQDTRLFAMQFFREQFSENDWNPVILITLADSVRPDVEAFGRELITKFFTEENGVQYLLQLSQHPGEKMQLFATNYLERFATDDIEKIQSLNFYFRSVLTRVNKSRVAKNRIYYFLLQEGRKSEEAAKIVSEILADISATAAIGDKAKCIEILLQLRSLYEVATPVKVKPMTVRTG